MITWRFSTWILIYLGSPPNLFFVLWHFHVILAICFIFYVHRIQLILVFCNLLGLIFELPGTRKDLAFIEVSEQSFILISHFCYITQKTIMFNSRNCFNQRFLSAFQEKTRAYQSLVMPWWNLAKDEHCMSLISLPSPFKIVQTLENHGSGHILSMNI